MASGPVGLLTGKQVHVFAARGGLYAGSPRDIRTSYVRDFLAFLGMSDVRFVYAEGLALGEASKLRAVAEAHAAIEGLSVPGLASA